MRRFQMTAVTAGLIGCTVLLFGAAPVSAATLPGPAIAAPGETAMVEEVQRRRGDRVRRHHSRRHRAHRSRRHARPSFRHHSRRHARRSFRHHHGPSFGFSVIVPGFAVGLGGGSSAHVQWCLNRYRSYDPSSDTFLGFDGYRHRCNSPYR
jgi:hypothetical protein